MICARPDCPIERTAKALDDIIREGEKLGAKFNAHMEHHAQCALCQRCVGWERRAEGDHRALRTRDADAA